MYDFGLEGAMGQFLVLVGFKLLIYLHEFLAVPDFIPLNDVKLLILSLYLLGDELGLERAVLVHLSFFEHILLLALLLPLFPLIFALVV